MEPDTPTHFNVILVGTGLVESIVAAALSKAGYSVLQLDQQSYYGDEWASLTLDELVEWAGRHPQAMTTTETLPAELKSASQRYSLSLRPTLLRAKGPAIDLLIRSKVASYLSFGLLEGTGLVTDGGKVDRVPSSKADVFNSKDMTLVEKRRLTKLLLFAASQEPLGLEEDSEHSFESLLASTYSLSPAIIRSLAFALTLCSTSQDDASTAFTRLRSIVHSIGRYGSSPFLVGHYGGAGDLVGGFSRICAVWGGGQILGRPIQPLVRDAKPGIVVPPSEAPFLKHDTLPPPPARPQGGSESEKPVVALGIPVEIERDTPPSTFTADWVVTGASHLRVLFPELANSDNKGPDSIHAIVILPKAVPFPTGPEVNPSAPDSNMFVFPPIGALGTCTALQVGQGTCATPAGFFALYLSAPVLEPASAEQDALTVLKRHISTLLNIGDTPIEPLYSMTYRSSPPNIIAASSLPSNMLVVPQLPSAGTTASLITALDEAALEAERIFWLIVGEQGKADGVEFFARDVSADEQDDE